MNDAWEEVERAWKDKRPRLARDPAAKDLRQRLLAPPERLLWRALCQDPERFDEKAMEPIRSLFYPHHVEMARLQARIARQIRAQTWDDGQLAEIANPAADLPVGFIQDMANGIAVQMQQEPIYNRVQDAVVTFPLPAMFESNRPGTGSASLMADIIVECIRPGDGSLHRDESMAFVERDDHWRRGEDALRQYLHSTRVWPRTATFDIRWKLSLQQYSDTVPLSLLGASASALMTTAIWRLIQVDQSPQTTPVG